MWHWRRRRRRRAIVAGTMEPIRGSHVSLICDLIFIINR
jgi:hypothetical protein